MNLHSRKVRLPIAALGVTALCSGGIGIFASPAFAATSLTLLPNTTAVTVTNISPNALGTADLGYGLALDGDTTTATKPMSMAVTGPASGSVMVERVSGAGSPGYTAPDTATTTTGALAAGDTAVAVTSSADITAGHVVKIGTGATAEYAVVDTVVDGTNITVTRGIRTAQISGAAVQDMGLKAYVPVASGSASLVPGYTSADSLYLGSDYPGAYTVQLFQDNNNNGTYDSATDYGAPAITLNVKDVTTATPATTDDLTYTVSSPASSGVGTPITASTTLGGVTTTDFRGSSNGSGVLGTRLADEVDFTMSGTGGATVAAPTTGGATFDGTKFSFTSGNVTGAGSVASTAVIGSAGTASSSTTVSDNQVATVDIEATEAAGSVKMDASVLNQVNVKTGTGAVTYKATALKAGAVPAAGVTVNFTITGTAAQMATIATNGTAVDTSGATSKVYSAVTNTSGVASLTVTSGTTTAGTTYTVNAGSNGHNGTAQTALYAAAAASTVDITSTSADLTPAATDGVSVTLKGRVMDQFGSAYTGSSGSQQVAIYFGTTAANCTAFAFTGQTTASAAANAALTNGTFSYTYTPTTTPTAGTCTPFGIGYDKNSNGVIGATEGVVSKINYGSAAAASSITISAPVDAATGFDLQDSSGITTGTAITGSVLDSANTALANKTVTVTGSEGVYFSDVPSPTAATTDDLVKSLTTTTSSTGALQNVYAFFTKSGDATITVTSGTASKSVKVTTDPSTDGYAVTAEDVVGQPGSILIVTGKVTDMFGNPVPSAPVTLSLSSSVGSLGDTGVLANSQGVWSTTLTTGSNQSGEAKLTATLFGQTANATANADWKDDAGLTFGDGDYQDEATVTVAKAELTLSATAKVVAGGAGGTAKLSGKYLPDTSVDIWSKESGEKAYSLMDSVTTDAQGEWGTSTKVDKSTYFIAKANGLSSPSDLTEVWSKVSLTAKVLGKGKVQLSANGDPNTKATLNFYRSVGGKDPVLKKITSSASGAGKVTVSLPKGTRSVYVTYKAPGTSLGQSKILKVKVK